MGRGILTCASLTLDKRIFQPTRVLQSNVHESTGQWRRLGVELGSEGREGDEREDEAELEGETERWRQRGINVGKVLCHNVAVRTDFLLSTMH